MNITVIVVEVSNIPFAKKTDNINALRVAFSNRFNEYLNKTLLPLFIKS